MNIHNLDDIRREERNAENRANYPQRQLSLGIPERYMDAQCLPIGVDSERHTEALRKCEEYAKNFPTYLHQGKSLIMVGPVGTGKTHAACGIANYIILQKWSARYTTARKLIRTVRSAWGGNADEQKVINEFINPKLLVIDEIGLSKNTQDEHNILTEIISDRYDCRKPMILASNLPLASDGELSLVDVLGDRVVSRLKELGSEQILFDWESLR